jgi:predicted dehydrogenase
VSDWNNTTGDAKLNEVRWGIVGVGDVCEVKSAPAMNLIERSKLVAVMRRNGEKAKDYAQRHGVPKWYDDADQLINDPEVNAIYIATPPESHEFYTIKAAQAGKPVYVEKPMARTHIECMSMIDACQKAKVPLFTAYYRRSLPNILKIQTLLLEKAIGEVRHVTIILNKTIQPDIVGASKSKDNWRVDPDIAGGGYFFDLASHQLDILDFLLGPIIEVQGFATNQANVYKAEDIVAGSFHFENGVLGTGVWCFSTATISSKEIITIVGSKGQISFGCFGDHSVTLEVDGKEKQIMKFDIPKHIQQPLIQTIVNEILGNGKCPSSGLSGARTSSVMDRLCRRID